MKSTIEISPPKLLGDLIDIRDGTHDTPAYVEHGIPLVTSKNLTDAGLSFENIGFISEEDHVQISKRSGVQKGDVLYGMIGTIGKPTLVEVDSAFSIKNIALFKKDPSVIDSKYLRWLLDSPGINAQIARASKGGTQKFVSLGALRSLAVQLPPLEEQRHIADILDQAETLRTQRRTALALLDSLTQSLFLDMFGDSAVNQKGWEVKTIEELCEVKGGKRLPKGAEYSPTPTPYRYIRVTNFSNGQVDQKQLLYLTPEIQKSIKRYIVNTGDVIISIAGSIGLVAPVPASLDGANLTENAAKMVQRRHANYLPDFLAFMLGTKAIQDQIQSHVGQVTIGKLALFRIEKLTIPLPPLPLQQTFATRIASIEALKATHRRALAALDALFASLQQRAFTGAL